MRGWFKDQHLRALLKNSSYLAGSRVVAAIAWVGTLSLAARGLGVELFGGLILIASYARAVSGVTKFQSWQLIVRYGGRALQGELDDFKASVGFAFALDLLSGFGGLLIGVAVLPIMGPWVGIQASQLWLAAIYCSLLPMMAAATPTGTLRVLDRFDLISWQATISPISRLMLVGIAFLNRAPFPAYVGAWYVTDLGGDLYSWFLAWRELRRRDFLRGIRPSLRPRGLSGAWRFAIHVNLTASVQAAWGPMARLAVGGLLGAAGAALFQVASSISDSAAKPTELLAKAFYPEVVRMDLATDKPWKLMARTAAIATAVASIAIAIVLIGGKPVILLLFGRHFLAAYNALMILMAVPLLMVLSFPLSPMLYALDRPDGPLTARTIGSVTFFVILAPLCWRFGLVGAATAFVVGNAATVLIMVRQLYGEHRRVRSPDARIEIARP